MNLLYNLTTIFLGIYPRGKKKQKQKTELVFAQKLEH